MMSLRATWMRGMRWCGAFCFLGLLALMAGGLMACSQCRFDVDCAGRGLCIKGACVGDNSEPVLDAGPPPPPRTCIEGETHPCYTGAQETRGKGTCADGKKTCTGGVWGVCDGEIKPTPEVCDGKDNDCNGKVDDGSFDGEPCIVPDLKGPCKSGIKRCVGGEMKCTQSVQPKTEECGNGQDDDCDGSVDEKPPCSCSPGQTQSCYDGKQENRGKGECKEGTQVCGPKDEGWGKCLGSQSPVPEVCDNKDNDCDGVIDNGVTRPCGRTVGTCVEGKETCKNGQWSGTCDGEIKPQPEECDGKDNNCDGTIDENITRPCQTACGNGVQACDNGTWKSCSAPGASKEICDNKDNNCDGQIDENVKRPCKNNCGSGTETCDRGQWLKCTAPPPSTEICDGVDNDCDGQTDESRSTTPLRLSAELTQRYYGIATATNGSEYAVLFAYDKNVYVQLFDKAGKAKLKKPLHITATPANPSNFHLFYNSLRKEYGAFWYYYSLGYKYQFARVSTAGVKLALKTLTTFSTSAVRIAFNGTYYGLLGRETVSGSPTQYYLSLQRFDYKGNAIGSTVKSIGPLQAYPYSYNIGSSSSNFGVVWYDYRTSGNAEVFFQKLNSTGTKSGAEVNVSNSTGRSSSPYVIGNSSYFHVLYLDSPTSSSTGNQVYATRISRLTGSKGASHKIATTHTSLQYPTFSYLGTSSTSELGVLIGGYNSTTSKREILFARLASTGALKGSALVLHTLSTGFLYSTSLRYISTGLFGAFWLDSSTGNPQIWFLGLCGI